MRFVLELLAAGCCLAAVSTAQQGTPAPATAPAAGGDKAAAEAAQRGGVLERLLDELRRLDAKDWQQHLQGLQGEAARLEQRAAAAREQAAKLERDAAADVVAAKSLREQAEKIAALHELLQKLPAPSAPTPPVAPAPAPATAPSAPASAPVMPAAPSAAPDAKMAAPAAPAAAPSVVPAAAPAAADDKNPAMAEASAEPVTWAHVEPIFSEHCIGCHDPDEKKGGLDLTSFAAASQGGGSGKSIVAGEPDQSRLFRMVAQQERPYMPRDADPLPAALQSRIRQWIEDGAAEDVAAARTFRRTRAAQAKAAAAAVDATAETPAPMPRDLPAVAVRTSPRAVPIAALARSPRGALLAMPGLQQVLLFDGELAPLGVMPCELDRIGALSFSADGTLLAVAGGDAGKRGAAVVHDVVTGAVVATVGAERDVPLAVAVHAGRRLVALGGSSKHVRLYSWPEGREVFAGVHDDFVLGLAFAPDGESLAAVDRAGNVVLWETATGRRDQVLTGHKGAVTACCFHRDGRRLLTTGADGTVRLWDVVDGVERWRKNAHRADGLAVAFGPGDALASCGSDGRIAVFTTAGNQVATSPDAGDWLYGVAFGTSDKTVVAGDARGRLQRFDVAGKKLAVATPLAPAN